MKRRKRKRTKRFFFGSNAAALLCRLERSPFPADIMRCAVQKCSSLQLYDNDGKSKNRNEQLFTTCAIIKNTGTTDLRRNGLWHLNPKRKQKLSVRPPACCSGKGGAGRLDSTKKGTQRNEDADAVCQAPHVCGKIDNRTAQNAYYPRLKPEQETTMINSSAKLCWLFPGARRAKRVSRWEKSILWDIICRKMLCTQRKTMIIMNRRKRIMSTALAKQN